MFLSNKAKQKYLVSKYRWCIFEEVLTPMDSLYRFFMHLIDIVYKWKTVSLTWSIIDIIDSWHITEESEKAPDIHLLGLPVSYTSVVSFLVLVLPCVHELSFASCLIYSFQQCVCVYIYYWHLFVWWCFRNNSISRKNKPELSQMALREDWSW